MIREKVPLRMIAHARSGDKGKDVNIGVIAYTEKGYIFLLEQLTKERIAEFFSPLNLRTVICYELPNLFALNFVLEGALGEGGSLSLRSDAQGKTLGQALLEMELSIPEELFFHCQQGCQ